jgi:cytoskeletal protein CcmA (bactofilin family)
LLDIVPVITHSGIAAYFSQGAGTMRSGEGVNSYIGKEVVLHGEITGAEDLVLDGKFKGTIRLDDSRLTIGPNARVHADIYSRDVVVEGEVLGNIQALGRVELRHSANVTGDLQAVHLMVEEGALIVGRIELAPEVRTATMPLLRSAETSLHAVYAELPEKKDPQHEAEAAVVAIASNG